MKIVSGGQTGVDRAALDVALRHEIECGGWILMGPSLFTRPRYVVAQSKRCNSVLRYTARIN
ncbi:MAG: hypothetical protein DME91_02555 [Verrucomicrobia bacterium]|nr:MAG: hypothetical protein DME91_02555 [Verrucomicrobiota bacterium]